MSKFIRSTALILASKVVVVATKIIISATTVRVLGVDARGIYGALGQLFGITSSFFSLSVGESFVYHYRPERRAPILGFAVSWLPVMAVFTALIIAAVQFGQLPGYRELLSPINVFYAGLAATGFCLEYLVLGYIRAQSRFRLLVSVSISIRSLQIVLLPLAMILFGFDIYGVFLLSALISLIASLVVVAGLVIMDGIALPNFEFAKSQLVYGGKVHIATIFSEIEYRADVLILTAFEQPAQIGIYLIGVTLAQSLWYLANSASTVLFPLLIREGAANEQDFYARSGGLFVVSFVILIGLLIVGAPTLQLIYGVDPTVSYIIFVLLSPGLLFDVVGRTFANWYKASGEPVTLSWITGFTLALNVSLNFAVIPTYGIYGAAIVSTCTYAMRLLLMVGFWRHKRPDVTLAVFFPRDKYLDICRMPQRWLSRFNSPDKSG